MKWIFTLFQLLMFVTIFSQDIIWENQGLIDEAVVPTGSTFSDEFEQVTVTLTWFTVTNGGSFLACCGDESS